MKSSIIPIFIPHLGCPNDCVFCNQKHIAAPVIPGADDVAGIIKEGLSHCEKPQISFYGGSFTCIEPCLQEAYLATAQAFVRDGAADGIRLSTRPDAIDAEVIARLKKYGVKTVEIGMQSMDDAVLAAAKRGHTAADCEKSTLMLKNAGFEVILQIMPGLPSSSREKDMQTARAVAALAPAAVRIYPVCVIRDTELFDMYKRGEYIPLTPDSAAELCAEIWEVFLNVGITVIRIGLNPTEELSGGAVAAGAYHPAMGQLVRSALMLRRAEKLADALMPARRIEISVPRGKLSDMRGQKNCNTRALAARYPGCEIIFREGKEQKELVEVRKV